MTGLAEDLRGHQSLGKFKDLGSLAKSYVELEKQQGGSIRMPDEKASPEDWDKFYTKIGRPEKPDGYQVKRPEMPEGFAYADEDEKNFLSAAHSAGLNAKQAQAMLDYYGGLAKGAAEHQGKAAAQAQSELIKEWGAEDSDGFKANLNLAQRALSELTAGKDDPLVKWLKESGNDSNPVLLRFFHKLGKELDEDTATHDGGTEGGNPDQEAARQKIAEIRNNKDHPYNNEFAAGHDDAVKEMQRLYLSAYPG